jgi:enoyl-CoA hydratase
MGEEAADTSLPVVVEERDRVAVIRLNRPAERNPLTTAVLNALSVSVSALRSREDVRGVIFTGAGDAFASGADIRELAALDAPAAGEFAARGQHLLQLISDLPLVTIAAVNGFCMGGGLDLALSCAVRVASPRAVFAHPGARLGIITGWGGTQRLPRLVGPVRALEMFLTARRVTAAEALEIGLVDFVSDDAVGRALELIARVPPRQ